MKVCGEEAFPPTPTVLNTRQFMTEEEVAEGVGEPHLFVAYSHALQWVGKAACGWKWEWPMKKTLQVKVSPLVHAFWEETGTDLTMACIKLCWEPAPRAIYCQLENGPTAQVITFLDELVVWVPTLDAWDQLVWPPTAVVPWALTEAELYGYCYGQAVDLSPVMPATQYRVAEEGGAYLCVVGGLVFEGSVLAYNPAMNEAERIPVHGLTNDLTWAKERSAVALVNYVPRASVEVAWIAKLGACQIVSCPNSSLSEEDETPHPKPQTTDTELEWEESEDGARQTDPEEEVKPDRWWHPQDWEAVIEGSERLAYDDPRSDSMDFMAMVMGADNSQGSALSLCDEAINCPPHTPRSATPCMLGLPMDQMLPLQAAIASRDAVKVHMDEDELNNL